MSIIRKFLIATALIAFTSPASAFILRTQATANAHACCLPNGSTIASASYSFSVTLSEVEEEYFGRQLAYSFQVQDQCGFEPGDELSTQTQRVLITNGIGAFITRSTVGLQPQCPFNVQSRSVARFVDTVARDTSDCQRPCPDCTPFSEW